MLRPSIIMLLMRSGVMRLILKLMRDRRVPIRAKLIIPAAIVYILLPFDIVPDFIPITGWIDDLLVTLLAGAMFLAIVPREVLLEHMGRRASASPRKGKVIDGEFRVLDDDKRDDSPNGDSRAA